LKTNPEEFNRLIALILYMGLVNITTFHRYWSTKTLYHGLWARVMMSRDRFKALMATQKKNCKVCYARKKKEL
jgi:hypothetical protein